VSGVVRYGSLVQLRSAKRSDHLLFSDSRVRSPVSTAQAVLNWRQQPIARVKSGDAPGQLNGNLWMVLGPRGTSTTFLRNHPVLNGSHFRLRHAASGAFLRGDVTVSAFARKDLHEVSAAADSDGEEWRILLEGHALGNLTWGLGNTMAVQHVTSNQFLTCSGQTYQVKSPEVFHKLQSNVHEIQLQQQVAGAASQSWRVAVHRKPAIVSPIPLSYFTVLRLVNPSHFCYMNFRPNAQSKFRSGQISCERTIDMSELWMVVPATGEHAPQAEQNASDKAHAFAKCNAMQLSIDGGAALETLEAELMGLKMWQLLEKADAAGLDESDYDGMRKSEAAHLVISRIVQHRRLQAACRSAAAQDVPRGPRLQLGSKLRLLHVLTGHIVHFRHATDSAGNVVAETENHSSNTRSCLQIRGVGSGSPHWISSHAAILQFCSTNVTLTNDSQSLWLKEVGPYSSEHPEGATWVGEKVTQLPLNLNSSSASLHLSKLCEKGRAYQAAATHLSKAISAIGDSAPNGSDLVLGHLLFHHARLQMRLGKPASALQDLTAVRRLVPQLSEASLYHGRIATMMGRWDDAHGSFLTVINGTGEDEPLHYRARLYLNQIGEINESLTQASDALNVSMTTFGSEDDGRCRISNADRDVLRWARRLMTDALQIAPESIGVRIQRAETNLLLGDLGAAKSDATWVIRLRKHSPEGYFLRGRAHLYMFDHGAARSFFRWCIRVDVEHAGCIAAIQSLKAIAAHTANATAAFRFGNFTGANTEYQAAIDVLPSHCFHVALMRLQPRLMYSFTRGTLGRVGPTSSS
jgi:tetratricopeptide (TPR) repeat protein